ncbi:hypothetical protein HY086_06920 [Candidatus Gottesmanbacteria bacterium]|nr:hypothetical protein [Candidatus Gottesmanbacteria bacterium]
MKNKNLLIVAAIIAALVAGVVGFKALSATKKQAPTLVEETLPQELEPLAPSVVVAVTRSKVKDNTLVLSISGMQSKYTAVAYELSYDSLGITQGVTSKPLDVAGKDSFVRDDIYLGTCSKNVCRPHPGVKKVSLVLEFTATSGKKSQFSKDFEL